MKETIIDLYNFQLNYLKKLVENIPEDQLYALQFEGQNSAGWILGHLAVEAEDVFNLLEIDYEPVDPSWGQWFRNTTGKIESLDNLPTKQQMLDVIDKRYKKLSDAYLQLTPEQRNSPHPSKMLAGVVKNLDGWFAHHLTTHIGIHCGNIAVWKKIMGIKVSGY